VDQRIRHSDDRPPGDGDVTGAKVLGKPGYGLPDDLDVLQAPGPDELVPIEPLPAFSGVALDRLNRLQDARGDGRGPFSQGDEKVDAAWPGWRRLEKSTRRYWRGSTGKPRWAPIPSRSFTPSVFEQTRSRLFTASPCRIRSHRSGLRLAGRTERGAIDLSPLTRHGLAANDKRRPSWPAFCVEGPALATSRSSAGSVPAVFLLRPIQPT
jgi:hypothetical protein